MCARATGRKRAAETDENRLFRVKGKFWFLLLSYWGFIYITGEMITREHRRGLLIHPTKQFMNDHDDNRTITVGFGGFFASFFFHHFSSICRCSKGRRLNNSHVYLLGSWLQHFTEENNKNKQVNLSWTLQIWRILVKLKHAELDGMILMFWFKVFVIHFYVPLLGEPILEPKNLLISGQVWLRIKSKVSERIDVLSAGLSHVVGLFNVRKI